MDGLIDPTKLGVDFEADVVNRLRAFWADHGVLLEHNLRRNSVDGVAESLHSRVELVVPERRDDDDHVGLSRLRELRVNRDKSSVQILEIRIPDKSRMLNSQASLSALLVDGIDERSDVHVGDVDEAPVAELFAVEESLATHLPFAVTGRHGGDSVLSRTFKLLEQQRSRGRRNIFGILDLGDAALIMLFSLLNMY